MKILKQVKPLMFFALLAFVIHPTQAAVIEAWVQRYNGPLNDNDQATAMAVDSSGNVVVTGQSFNQTDGDYYTAKYAAADGALLWEKRYNGPANSNDQATAVAVDGGGNVVVTGYSYNGANPNYYTAKYAAGNGALLWEKRYNGPANSEDLARAVAVDGGGNVVVTGYSFNQTDQDYYTAKYAAGNGALLWEKRYNDSDDLARALAVDGSGNVVVTGYSQGDYYTAKYAAANGALLWEKRYNGGGVASSLAIGPNGMVAVTGFSSPRDYVTVVYWENLPAVAIAPDGTGGYFIRGSGSTGFIYQLQRATSVTGPWMSNATITVVSPGLIEFRDTNAPSGQAFYRIAQP